jgi:L-fucose isomerase-like protein
MNHTSSNFTRREFIGTSARAAGVFALTPAGISSYFFGPDNTVRSAAHTPLTVKFVQTGVIHEETYEGSCRTGQLNNLTMEAETRYLQTALDNLKQQVNDFAFQSGIRNLQPEVVSLWVAKGNPEIMMKNEEIEKLREDDKHTDVYVVTGGLPQFTCLRIAEVYKKPVVLANVPGWGLDAPAGLRAMGHEGFYVKNMEQLNSLLMVFKARKGIRQTKLLNVTNFNEVPKGVISSISDIGFLQEQYGLSHHTVDYREFFSGMDQLVQDGKIRKKAGELANALINGASARNMSDEDVANSFYFYLTVLHFLSKYDCNAFGIECFELCSSMEPWNRRFTPCMTHSLLKNAGFPSACEKDLSALMAMTVLMYISQKPAYMGNPDFDLDNDIITLHHSDSPTKMHGFDQPDDYYEIKSFTESGFGATLRYDYEQQKGQQVTLARFDPAGKKLLILPGEISGGGGLDGYGCSQKVSIKVRDCKETVRIMHDFGHHLAMVYDDWTDPIRDLAVLAGFETYVL